MHIQLGELAARGLHVQRPGQGPDGPAQRIHLASADALTGELDASGGGFTAREVACARLALSELAWAFGAVLLQAAQGGELTALRASARSADGSFELDLTSATLSARPLALALPSLALEAELEAQALVLTTRDNDGRISCEQAVFRDFSLRASGLELSAPELVVHNLSVGWGARFQLTADTATAPKLTVRREGVAVMLDGLALAAVSVAGPHVTLGQLRVERVQLAVELAQLRASPSESAMDRESKSADAPDRAARANGKGALAGLLDPSLLDGLSGRIDGDVHVDLSVPVLGRRRAKHELRLAVDGGAIDYRALEHGLATLEDSLLDFSVRDGALVLERGLPLLKTRGRGKPILKWELGAADLALAEQQRVRLAVLPQVRAARDSEPEERSSKEGESSSFALRELSVLNLDVVLAQLKSAVATSNIRELTFANLTLRGELRHDADTGVPPGQLELGLATLRVLVEALPIGAGELRGRLELSSLSDGQITFADVRPRTVSATLEGLSLADFAFDQVHANA